MQRIVYDELSAAWAGKKTSAEAMDAAEANLEKLFQELKYTKEASKMLVSPRFPDTRKIRS